MIARTLKSLTQDELEKFEQDGFFIARGLFTPEEIAVVKEAFQAVGDQGPVPVLQKEVTAKPGVDDPLMKYPRMMSPHVFPDLPVGPVAKAHLLDGRVGDILYDLFGEEPMAVNSMYYFKPPGARGQALHQDNFYLRVAPVTCMAAWTAIDDVDEENGGLMVVPGSQGMELACPETSNSDESFTTEYVPIPDGLREVEAALKAGDVLFFNGSLIHGSYANRSRDRWRRSLICHYGPLSSKEVGDWYLGRPLYTFDGREVDHVDPAQGAGPCGTEYESGLHVH